MQLTRQGDYAMRAILFLAASPQARIQEIARAQFVPKEYLAKIVQKLSQAGIVTTHRGVGGGITLARPPEEITLLDVVEAIEGPVALNSCFIRPGECPRESYCAIHAELEHIGNTLARMFANVNFADLAKKEAALCKGAKAWRLETGGVGEM
ncbi:MAG: Rrf2 family transcriptional regulator [Thermoleophilia bacterium]|nr:Rrf2 family transcriptional regulator [Thermoleophilia bacterium]